MMRQVLEGGRCRRLESTASSSPPLCDAATVRIPLYRRRNKASLDSQARAASTARGMADETPATVAALFQAVLWVWTPLTGLKATEMKTHPHHPSCGPSCRGRGRTFPAGLCKSCCAQAWAPFYLPSLPPDRPPGSCLATSPARLCVLA